jgi:hypothetical protein
MLKPVDIAIAHGRVTWNTLYYTSDPRHLTQDLLLVELPGGLFIDVSWFPEHDPRGAYHITLCRNDWECKVDAWVTRSISDVISLVQGIAQRYGEPLGNYSCSAGRRDECFIPAA